MSGSRNTGASAAARNVGTAASASKSSAPMHATPRMTPAASSSMNPPSLNTLGKPSSSPPTPIQRALNNNNSGGAAPGFLALSPAIAPATAAVTPERPPLIFTLRLVVHPKSFSTEDLILNPKSVPGLKCGEMIEIYQVDTPSQSQLTLQQQASLINKNPGPTMAHANTIMNNATTNLKNQQQQHATSGNEKVNQSSHANHTSSDPHTALFIKVESLEPVKANFDISLSSTLADLFNLQARKDVIVRVINDTRIGALEFIEISFKNQYIGRSDNWRIKKYLQNHTCFTGQAIAVEGMKLRVDEILLHGRHARSGLVTPQTRFTFRSRSARLFFLIQLSEEMWDFADDGELYFEKVLGFLKILFAEWQKLKVTHALSIIFFSRTYLEVDEEWAQRKRNKDTAIRDSDDESSSDDDGEDDEEDEESEVDDVHSRHAHDHNGEGRSATPLPTPPPVQTDPNSGKLYQDHYMVVIDNEVFDSNVWETLIKLLKKRFNKYHLQLKWGTTDAVSGLRGYPSTAAEGNFLEAINMSVSVYDKHYLDRDLYKTGQNIVLFSAGIGMFVVDPKLARLTKQRMVDGGIGCDLICMTRPPLHSVPLFSFKGATMGSSGASTAAANQNLTSKEQSRLSRAQTGPASSSSSHHHSHHPSHSTSRRTSTFQAFTGPIQEGSEENEEKTDETIAIIQHHQHGRNGEMHIDAKHLDSLYTHHAAAVSSASASPPTVSSSSAIPSSSSSSSILLPPPSDLSAARIEPSPSPTPSPQQSSGTPVTASGSGNTPGEIVPAGTNPYPHQSTYQLSPASSTTYTLSPGNGITPLVSPQSSVSSIGSGSITYPPMSQTRSPTPEAMIVRMTSVASEKDLTKLIERQQQQQQTTEQQPQYSVPHWLSIYFYDYQDLYDTPFGSLKTSYRDDTSRNRNEEFVSLSSCKLFDFFDLSFFNTGEKIKPSLVPYFPSKEIAPPLNPSLFEAYDASVFSNTTQPIGLISQQSSSTSTLDATMTWKSISPSSSAMNLTAPPAKDTGRNPPTATNTLKSAVPSTTSTTPTSQPHHTSTSSTLFIPGTDHHPSSKKKLGGGSLKKRASGGGGSFDVADLTQTTTSGPNVALQQHVLNQGAKTTTTAFQTRWGHLFGHLYATLDHLHNPLRPNWKSLCQPAVLPLTTEYWPAQSELRINYFEYNHTLVLVQNQNDYNNNTAALLEEVICQRQAQDYQHIVSDEIPPPKPGLIVEYFSLRNQVHQITLDKRTNTIEVRRHVHKRVIQDLKLVKFPYTYYLWNPHSNAFLSVQRDIEPNRDELKWSDADNLLCDRYSVELSEEMKYRRNHYAIIPSGVKFQLGNALHLNMLNDHSTSNRASYQEEWNHESEKRIQAIKQFFCFMFTERGDKIVTATNVSTKDTMVPQTPTQVKEKQEKLAAAQAVLNQAFTVYGIDIDLGKDDIPFPLPPVKSEKERAEDYEQAREYLEEYEHALGFAIKEVNKREIKIPLTKSASSSSDDSTKRYEWFQLQYDTTYNPHAVFHMEIKWLVATGMHLENWLKNFVKKAETRFGLQIVKIPTNQPLRSGDSFHVPVPLPVHNPHVQRLVEEYLLLECAFVVDSELEGGCRQYVHETGMCAVRRLPSGFVWINNFLPTAAQHRKASVQLFVKIKKYAQRLIAMRVLVQTMIADVSALQLMKSSVLR